MDLQLDADIKRVTLGNGHMHEALAVIFATGSAYRKVGIPDEERLSGHGVSWCATCDGFFFRNKTIAVVGGGDSAMEEATFLTRFADKVYVIHRGPTLRASKTMQNRAFGGCETILDLQGLFIAIGADPRTHLVHGKLDFNPDGTIAVQERSSRTSVAGVFAAGDVLDSTYRQAVTAAGSGTVAALDTEHYLASLPTTVLAQAVGAL